MPRASLPRNAPLPVRYRLTTPPPMNNIVLVARGRRLPRMNRRARPVEPSAPSPEVPTDPESSPTVRPSRTLRRTYTRTMMQSTEGDRNATSHSVAKVSTVVGEVQHGGESQVDPESQNARLHDWYNYNETPITGIQLGTGLYRLVNPSDLPIQIFDAPMAFEKFIQLRLQLDSSDGGLTLLQFRDMVGECGGCERAMLMRSKDHHRCPGKNALPTLVPAKELFSLLDSTAGGQGLTRNQFQHLFASCLYCNRIFTYDAAIHHTHIDNEDDEMDL